MLDTAVAVGSVFELIYKSRTPDLIEQAIATPPVTLWLRQTAVIAAACAEVALGYLKNDAEYGRQERRYQMQISILTDEEDEARTDEFGAGIIPDTEMRVAAFGREAR